MNDQSWRRNVYIVFAAQFMVTTGLNCVNPFMPLFVKGLSTLSDTQAAFWGGLAMGASPLAMFLTAPLWGIVADRWGRKPMVLRAMFGGGIILGCVGLAPNTYYVVGMRFMQGVFAGTMAAASALVASLAPRDRIPFAMGLLMVSAFGGSTAGPLFGGFVADMLGLRAAFFVTGGLIVTAGLMVLAFVRERFEGPKTGQAASLGGVWRLASSRQMLPLLAAMCALQIGPQMLWPVIPLVVREMAPQGMAASLAGVALALMGTASALASAAFSRFGARMGLRRVLVYSCFGCAALYLPPIWAATVVQLIAFIALVGIFKGGLMASSNSLIGLSVASAQHGLAYGLGQSANSLGNGLGPLIGGSLAGVLGLRPVFTAAAILFLALGTAIALLPRTAARRAAAGGSRTQPVSPPE
jgi:DHA1 family multidrug resistance protein-like MFS transporter